MLTDQGHIVNVEEEINKNELDNIDSVKMSHCIMEALDVDIDTFNLLIEKQKKSIATNDEKFQIKRYLLLSQFGLKNLNKLSVCIKK